MKLMSHPHPARVLLTLILSFSLLSFVTTAPSIPQRWFNATDLIPRADRPESHPPESSQPHIVSQHGKVRNPIPTALSNDKFKTLVENGKLMFAYLEGKFNLPASKIQGPEEDEDEHDWYKSHKESLKSQGWVYGAKSETKRDFILSVCEQTLERVQVNPEFTPIASRLTPSVWEKQSSGARYSQIMEDSNLIVYEMKGLPESTYPATDLGYLEWESLVTSLPDDYPSHSHQTDYPNYYRTTPGAIIFANIYNKDAEDLVERVAPYLSSGWPGINYHIQGASLQERSKFGYAFLGTTFGQYATYFLRTHRSQFGEKEIWRIHVLAPRNIPDGWDTHQDGPYPHIFVFRIRDSSAADKNDPAEGESSGQAAARLGGSSKDPENSPHDDTESVGGEPSGQAVSSHGGFPHSQHEQHEESSGGSQNTEGGIDSDQVMGDTSVDHSGDDEESSDRMEISDHNGESSDHMDTSDHDQDGNGDSHERTDGSSKDKGKGKSSPSGPGVTYIDSDSDYVPDEELLGNEKGGGRGGRGGSGRGRGRGRGRSSGRGAGQVS